MGNENERKLTVAILVMAIIRQRRFGKQKIVRRHSSVLIKPCLTNRDRKVVYENACSDDNEKHIDNDETIAERLRRKNQELISSSDQTKSTDRYSTSRDKENVPSRNRTSLSSVSDSSSNKDLKGQLDAALKELEEYKRKYEEVKREKEELQKQMEQHTEDIEKMQELKNENLRLKDENGALIRVISKLSPRTPSS